MNTDAKNKDEAVAARRDSALRRALSTPPTPHKPTGKSKQSPKRAQPRVARQRKK